MRNKRCLYCSQENCGCGANDYAGRKAISKHMYPYIMGGYGIAEVGDEIAFSDNVGVDDPRKEELLKQIKKKNRRLTISLFIEAFGGIISIISIVLGLADLVNLSIAIPSSYIGLFIFLLGLVLAGHFDDSEAMP